MCVFSTQSETDCSPKPCWGAQVERTAVATGHSWRDKWTALSGQLSQVKEELRKANKGNNWYPPVQLSATVELREPP